MAYKKQKHSKRIARKLEQRNWKRLPKKIRKQIHEEWEEFIRNGFVYNYFCEPIITDGFRDLRVEADKEDPAKINVEGKITLNKAPDMVTLNYQEINNFTRENHIYLHPAPLEFVEKCLGKENLVNEE